MSERRLGHPLPRIIGIVTLAIFLNLAGNVATPWLNGLLFLDMLGTALAAFAIGPWWGALVGVVTNLLISLLPSKVLYFNYTIVNILAALFWGYIGRTSLSPFPARNSQRGLFFRLLVSGALCGLICSVSALYTRVRFNWVLTTEIVDNLPVRHATDQVLKWAVGKKLISAGQPAAFFLPLDLISIVPDKIVSTAFGALVLFYFLPSARRTMTRTQGRRLSLWPVSEIAFFLVYLFPFISIATKGDIVLLPSGEIRREVIIEQIILWSLPLVAAIATVAWKLRRGERRRILSQASDPAVDENEGLRVDEVYRDVIAVVSAAYALLLTTKLPLKEAGVDDFVKDGVGIVYFFTLMGLLPAIVLRYVRGSEVKL